MVMGSASRALLLQCRAAGELVNLVLALLLVAKLPAIEGTAFSIFGMVA